MRGKQQHGANASQTGRNGCAVGTHRGHQRALKQSVLETDGHKEVSSLRRRLGHRAVCKLWHKVETPPLGMGQDGDGCEKQAVMQNWDQAFKQRGPGIKAKRPWLAQMPREVLREDLPQQLPGCMRPRLQRDP